MSTIACPRCKSVFPLAQVAQFDQFTCGACGAIIPVPITSPSAIPPVNPVRPSAPPPTMALPPGSLRPQTRTVPAPAPAPRPAPLSAPPARAAAPAQRAAAAPAPAPRPAAPAAGRAAPPATRRAPPPAAEPEEAPRRSRHEDEPEPKKSPMPLVLAGVGALVLIGGFFALRSGGSSESDTPTAPALGAGNATPAIAKPAGDPDKDIPAWNALPEADRKIRAQLRAASVDSKQEASARATYEWLLAREEKDLALGVARDVARVRSELEWPHVALGHEDLRTITDRCVAECTWSDSFSTEAMQELVLLKESEAPKRGAWWGDEATQTRVKDLVTRIREEEKELGTPHGQAVAKWVAYHRSIDVMREFPAIHGTAGPYLVFVSLPVPDDKKGKESLSDVKPADKLKGDEILKRTLALYDSFYEGWHSIMGPILGLKKYGPENVDRESMLLVNVFTSAKDYEAYNGKTGGPSWARAYYSPQEPRFITTYDGEREGGEKDPDEDTAQIQCHEGTHQLVHFYTWDTSRKKAAGNRLEWLACRNRRMWSQEGFAEFFSSYKKDGDKYLWMQPLDSRLADLWLLGEILKERGWEDWRLREVLDPVGNQQMQAIAQSRQRKPSDAGMVVSVMANLFYAKGWSLNYFLWYAEENGKPKYRDRFIEYIKKEFDMTLVTSSDGRQFGRLTTPDDLKRTIGVTNDDAFDKEWRAFEAGLIQKYRNPRWDERRARVRKAMGLDGSKPEPGK